MMQMRLLVFLVGLLLPILASCSSPPGRYQRAIIQSRDGVPCFTVPNTRETRAHSPLIAGISVTEVGTSGVVIWERIFLQEGNVEPVLSPDQCLLYGGGGGAAPVLQAGKRYSVEMSGFTSGNAGEAQKRVFSTCFYMTDVDGKGIAKPVVTDCASAVK